MMTTLGKELHQTISDLEYIRDTQKPPPPAVYSILDQLYALQIVLIDAAIQKATVEYVNATAAMENAAKETRQAIDDLKKLESAIEKIGVAIEKVAPLLALAI